MSEIDVRLDFGNTFQGSLRAGERALPVGKDGFRPYELLLGALGGCYYATLVDILKKMRIGYRDAAVQVKGRKRQETPTHLEWCEVQLTVRGASDKEKMERAAQLAARYCSVYYTISRVCDIELKVLMEH